MSSTGYGPSSARCRLQFDGDESKYELWEVKFLGYMRLQKLSEVITGIKTNDAKNAEAFAELVQLLDDKSLSLVIRECKDDGKKALDTLREHYLGQTKPRIISLYTTLTSLKMNPEENVTDYIIRAETAATRLNNAGEQLSDSLLIAMVLKGLPAAFRTFSTVITQSENEITFAEFKVSLKNFEENEKCYQNLEENENKVMRVQHRDTYTAYTSQPRENYAAYTGAGIDSSKGIICYNCGQLGHRKFECKSARWCNYCKSKTHYTYYCRRKNEHSAKTVQETQTTKEKENSDHSFAFQITDSESSDNSDVAIDTLAHCLLVDCGATTHIINDKSKFVRINTDFDPSKHYIELADGSKTSGVAIAKGDASVELCDNTGKIYKVLLKNALCIPSYKQNIFSVHAATEEGATVNFKHKDAELQAPDGTTFNIKQQGRLYYLNHVSHKIVNSKICKTVEMWHKILGHCNIADILKLEDIVEGMKIEGNKDANFNCDICSLGKMPQFRNREPDERAKNKLDLVHCDLAGPIKPTGKDGFNYAICFVDDYTGLFMIYLLKQKVIQLKLCKNFWQI